MAQELGKARHEGLSASKHAVSPVLPRYLCHKNVSALKIEGTILRLDGSMVITPDDIRYQPFGVTKEYVDRNTVIPGGYWVRYEDGYESFSPKIAFESGYTLIE